MRSLLLGTLGAARKARADLEARLRDPRRGPLFGAGGGGEPAGSPLRGGAFVPVPSLEGQRKGTWWADARQRGWGS